jgi:hypothetical protein
MKRKLVALMALLASLSLAQTASPTVTVNIPQVLKLTLDATEYVFNFGSNASGTVSVNSVNYPRASLTAYEAFLAGSTTTPLFAPSTVNGGTGNEYGTLEIVTNQRAWTVKIQSIGTSTFPALTLGNDRVKVFAEKVSGKGASWTATPTSITAASPLTLFNAGSGGQGRSVYKLYYLFEMNVNDDIPTAGLNESIQITLVLTAP